jgi:thiamine phosphate synthase YjbQ (UPF0047 family)
MKHISVSTRGRTQFADITQEVQDAAAALGVREGVVTVFVPHTTAGITINEHAEGNAAAHVKASLMGSSVRVPVSGGRLRLGTWQGVFLCEFDGPRERSVWVAAG